MPYIRESSIGSGFQPLCLWGVIKKMNKGENKMKTLMKVLGIMMIALVALTACSPNPGGNDNDKNAFYITHDMKNRAGEYTLLTENEVTGEGYIESGKLVITEDDVTATLTVGDSTAYIFGTTDSLKEFYNKARDVDVNSVYVSGGDGVAITRIKISSATYEFDWQSFSLKDNMGVFRIVGNGPTTVYYMQATN